MTIFIVCDTDNQDFPKNEEDLNKRIKNIAYWIPSRRGKNNIEFVKAAFTLIKDCGLITEDFVEKLNNEQWCFAQFNCQMNPMNGGGVLRKDGLTMWSSSNLRYYCPFNELKLDEDIHIAKTRKVKGASKLAVVCNGVAYYISNNWFDDENRKQKRIFHQWLSKITHQIFKQNL